MTQYLYRCAFEYGGEGEFYMHIRGGAAVGFLTLTGEPLELPQPCGYGIVSAEIDPASVGIVLPEPVE